MKNLISVIIPNWNSEVLDKVIRNLNKQAYKKNFEIIIAGNDKYNIIKPQKNLKFVKINEKKNPAQNRNIAIKKAKGDTLLFLDSDCIPNKDWLENFMKDKNKIVQGSVNFKSKNFWVFCDNFINFYNWGPTSKKRKINIISTNNLKMPKSLIEKVGLFDETLDTAEDIDVGYKLEKLGYKFHFNPKCIVKHYHNRDTFKKLLKHSISWSENGIKVRLKHKKIPLIFKNKLLLLLSAPFLSSWIILRMFMVNYKYLKYFYLTPIIFLTKFAWVIGAYKGLKND